MNRVKKIAVAATFLCVAIVFAGCGSSLAVTDKSIPEEQRATLYLVGNDKTLDKVDGKAVSTGWFGLPKTKGPEGTKVGGMLKKELKPTAQIPPGEHKLTISVPSGLLSGGKQEATYNFEPGKKYRVAYEQDLSEAAAEEMFKSAKGALNAISEKVRITEITGEIPKE